MEMEGRLKLMLMETQERESRLTAAEEAVGMKRESMERDLANRMTEAQQVCRRALIGRSSSAHTTAFTRR
jgi:hypothetical protein